MAGIFPAAKEEELVGLEAKGRGAGSPSEFNAIRTEYLPTGDLDTDDEQQILMYHLLLFGRL